MYRFGLVSVARRPVIFCQYFIGWSGYKKQRKRFGPHGSLSFIFFKILYTIRYLVFDIRIVGPNSNIRIRYLDILDTKQYSVFGIQIFSIGNSIQYSVFGDFYKPNNIWYLYSVKQGYFSYSGSFLPEKRVLQDLICCPSAVNKCLFKRTYYFISGKECLVFDNIICCPPYTVPLGSNTVSLKK